jgi:hypothetical protein
MNKIQTEEEFSTINNDTNILSKFISNIITKTKEQEKTFKDSEIQAATNIATVNFNLTNKTIGNSTEYFREVLQIFHNIFQTPTVSTQSNNSTLLEPNDTTKHESENNLFGVEIPTLELESENKIQSTSTEINVDDSLQNIFDCIDNPEKCL